MAFNFENLNVWKMSVEYADDIHKMTRKFPKDELFSLSSQAKRAALSISLNIAEGATGNSKPEFKRFLVITARSCAEVVTCLYHPRKRKYIDSIECGIYYNKVEVLYRMINKLRNSI